MADITLPTPGDDENVWGDKLNAAVAAVNVEASAATATNVTQASSLVDHEARIDSLEAGGGGGGVGGLPAGGATNTALVKNTSADGDASWKPVVLTVNGSAPDAAGDVAAVGGGGGISVHGQLSGLSADDHPQYHTNVRGDARYYTKATVDGLVSSAATQTSVSDRARTNHTGEQPISSVTGLDAALAGKASAASVGVKVWSVAFGAGTPAGAVAGDAVIRPAS